MVSSDGGSADKVDDVTA